MAHLCPPELPPARVTLIATVACVYDREFPYDGHPAPPSDNDQLSFFHTVAMPSINIHDYLARLVRFSFISDEALILSQLLVLRLHRHGGNLTMNPYSKEPFRVSCWNLHRLIAASVTLAHKLADDGSFTTTTLAPLVGMPAKQLGFLEAQFFDMCDHNVAIPAEAFVREWNHLLDPTHHQSCIHEPCPAPLQWPLTDDLRDHSIHIQVEEMKVKEKQHIPIAAALLAKREAVESFSWHQRCNSLHEACLGTQASPPSSHDAIAASAP